MAGKVLVVDDDANVQRLLQYTLKQEGYEVLVAADGAEGLALWQQESPSLILLDATPAGSTATRSRRRSGPRKAPAATSRSSCSPPSATCSRRSAPSAPAPTTT